MLPASVRLGERVARKLDVDRGGYWDLGSIGVESPAHRAYLEGTLVLETTFEAAGGAARVLGCLSIPFARRPEDHAQGSRLLRVIEGRCGRGSAVSDHLHTAVGGNDALVVRSDIELEQAQPHELTGRFTVNGGDRVRFVATYTSP